MSGTSVPSSFDEDEDFHSESRLQIITRRLKQEPLVPLGCMLTVFALLGATRAMRKNDHHTANKMFRRRIYAQGFTIAALVVGSSYWKGDREKRKEFDKVEGERRRVEKRERWLKELEVRDEEDKALRREAERRGARKAERREELERKELEKEGSESPVKPVTEAAKDLSWGKEK
ncbi:putative mitochondrial hypoxia responsive domain containing protein [Venturia nashicola]|uniref:Putative mitochondrial hypoxia responsive domain containing protein n=1 Tax=Venturia nashicola TaxID=86259 RepID=A0A4Z1PDF7_9PEZI|nr:putative mitochondrial hypoxia responsive domain containing protein [Venturia nashicola]TLD35869.1 putative mitochondrial hypoxia responsive domain containing protein [Venturia nashicola]